MDDLLSVQHLQVTAEKEGKSETLVENASFSVRPDEVLILLGESGSGKTVLSRAVTKLFPVDSRIGIHGHIFFGGTDLLGLDAGQMSSLRRTAIRYVFQDPLRALNPVASIRSQMMLAAGCERPSDDLLQGALQRAGIDRSREVLRSYPHQLSMGLAQRVMIAMALLPSPRLLIADEPTSALDVQLRGRLTDLLEGERRARKMSMLFITHDLDLARRIGGRVLVLYRGRIIESAPTDLFFDLPLHPYCRIVLDAQALAGAVENDTAPEGGGSRRMEAGCRFAPHCPEAEQVCFETEPPLEAAPGERTVRCHFWK